MEKIAIVEIRKVSNGYILKGGGMECIAPTMEDVSKELAKSVNSVIPDDIGESIELEVKLKK